MASLLGCIVALSLVTAPAGAAPAPDAGVRRAVDAFNAKDFATAFRLFLPSAAAGNRDAQFAVAEMYRTGRGVDQDLGAAAHWYRRAAEQGHAIAQCNLGTMYFHGQGVERNAAAALRWWERAAAAGNATAQFNLGLVYARGNHVARDLVVAYGWLYRASRQGHRGARRTLASLRLVMSRAELMRAEAMVRGWGPSGR